MGGRGGSSHRRTGGGLSSLTTTAQVSDWIRHQHWFQPHSFVNLDGVDVVAAREIAAAAGPSCESRCFAAEDRDGLYQAVKAGSKPGDCVLLKGSNSMKLSEAVKHLKETRS